MMEMFADEIEQRVSDHCCQCDWPHTAVGQTFRHDCEERDAQKCSSGETNQRAKRLVRQLQRRADPSTGKGESISSDNLPERVNHLGARARCVIFAAVVRLDSNVNEFIAPAEQRSICVRALRLMRHHRDHGRKFSDADLPNVEIAHE